ncbi:MAG: C-GCAxxG-C-C family protein [Candidatus Helarchaeota archaeon]
MDESLEAILNKAYELGKSYEQKCTGCAQTSLSAIFDALGIWSEDVFKAASGLADGLGLTTDGSCGALIGGALAISFIFGREKKDFKDVFKPFKSYELVKKLHDEYVLKHQTCRCNDVQKSLFGRTYNLWDQNELQEAFSSGMIDKCSEVVGTTARMAVKIILEAGFKPKHQFSI